MYRINEAYNEHGSIHPFDPFNVLKANKLIIGSIPPYRFCNKSSEAREHDVHWYYGSRDNGFWKIYSDLTHYPFNSIEDRQLFCQHHNIGIFDLVHSCTRINHGSASDQDLYNIELICIKDILENNSNDMIELYFTSSFVVQLFNARLSEIGDKSRLNRGNRDYKNYRLFGKDIRAIVLYSPSPQAIRGMKANSSEEKINIRKNQYSKILNEF